MRSLALPVLASFSVGPAPRLRKDSCLSMARLELGGSDVSDSEYVVMSEERFREGTVLQSTTVKILTCE